MRCRPRYATLALAASLLAPAVEADVPTVATVAKEFEALSLSETASRVDNVKLAVGHLEVTLASGSRAPVKAGHQTVGFFFVGSGSFVYRSEDPIEAPLVQFNAKKATSIKVQVDGKAVVLKDTFKELLVLAANVALPGETEGGARDTALETAFRAHRDAFGRVQGSAVARPFVLQRLDAPKAGAFRMEAAGGTESWLYVWDSIDVTGERLDAIHGARSSLSDDEVKKRLWRSPLSFQVAQDRRDPLPPTFVVTDIAYTLRASDGRNASVSAVETVVPVGRPRSVLAFRLDSVAWDSTQTGVVNLRTVNVRSVKSESGAALPFVHDRGSLLVGLPAPAPPEKPIKLAFEIDGDFLIRPNGAQFWRLMSEDFLPMPPMAGGLFTLRSTIRVKKPYVPFAPGTTKSRREEGDENVLETELDKPVDFPVAVAGNYRFVEEKQDGLTVRVASYAMDRPTAFRKLAALASTIVKYYEGFLGPFPVTELNILEVNDYGWGQAPPGMLFITQEAFNPYLGMEEQFNRFFSQGINHRFAHEIAHQYWGTVVKMPSWEEQWIDEAFAEYSAALFIRDAKGKGHYDMLVARWKADAKEANDVAPIPLANSIEMPDDRDLQFLYRTQLIYGKGPYLLSRLHQEVGEETFLTFLKSYQKSFKWKFGTTKHVAGLLGFLTKRDFGPFFEANYWGTGLPK